MGWSIHEVKNTVDLPKAAEAPIRKWALKTIDIDDVVADGKLYFNPDYMEHMDFLWQEAQNLPLHRGSWMRLLRGGPFDTSSKPS